MLKFLCEIEVHLYDGSEVGSAYHIPGITDKSYFQRKKFSGLCCSQVFDTKSLRKENERLKIIVVDPLLDQLFLKEGLDHLKPWG